VLLQSYSDFAEAAYSFSASSYSNVLNLTIWAGKKHDRGDFAVYLNKDLIGTGRPSPGASDLC
jgi:hypothetical protein